MTYEEFKTLYPSRLNRVRVVHNSAQTILRELRNVEQGYDRDGSGATEAERGLSVGRMRGLSFAFGSVCSALAELIRQDGHFVTATALSGMIKRHDA